VSNVRYALLRPDDHGSGTCHKRTSRGTGRFPQVVRSLSPLPLASLKASRTFTRPSA